VYDVPASFSFAISVILGALNDYLALRAQHGWTILWHVPFLIEFKVQMSKLLREKSARFAL
jgi:hypothetical protein